MNRWRGCLVVKHRWLASCRLCTKISSNRSKLKCPQCEYSCEYRSNLNRHIKSKHENEFKLEYDNSNKENAQCTFLIKTSNILNVHIVIGLIGGHVLLCTRGVTHGDTWSSGTRSCQVRWLGHSGNWSPRHCNRGHHEIGNTNSNLVHFSLITNKT